MTEERENYLSGLVAIVMSGAFFPTLCVISDKSKLGELKYVEEDSYDPKFHEEPEQTEEKPSTH